MKMIKRILLVEDNPGDARLLREMLIEDGSLKADLTCVSLMAEAEQHLAADDVDLVLLDLGLPDAQGLAVIRRARIVAPDTPLVVLTGMDDEALAAQSLQEGAQDYLIKGQIDSRGLLRALRYATERKRVARMKDEFVSTVSHELRTPLTSIAGSLGLLVGKSAGTLSAPASRLLEIAHSNSQRLVRLVNDILDIEKLESGRVAFDFTQVAVSSLVAKTVEAIRGYAEGHGVKIQIAAATVDDVRADPDRLAQVVTNLLSNAIKFSPPDGDVVVTIAEQLEADLVRISVRDHGCGIPLDFKSRIFERFAQADATNTRRKGGTGLGLSIAKQIVDRLGGEIGFADVSGGGTVFYVDLPIWKGIPDIERDHLIRDPLSIPVAPLLNVAGEGRDILTLAPAGVSEETA